MDAWTSGYRQSELDEAQELYDLRFPPDLVELLREKRPSNGYDWRSDGEAIARALRWPLEGLLFEVEENDFWLAEWGGRPSSAMGRAEVVTAAIAQAPKLIPIMGHRYIPEEPTERGNPVVSIYQSDIIYYGVDLDDYFRREFQFASRPWEAGPVGPIRRIRFWSDLVDRHSCEGRA
jgi:hypothetical protein